MLKRPETFREIRRRVLARRIIQLRFANTLSYGDIRRVMVQLDSGEWLEVSGMPGLTISLVPLLHPDANRLSVGGEGLAPPELSCGGLQEENTALNNRLSAMQEAVDKAYSLLHERHDPCWLMNRAERILNSHRTK